MLLDYLSLTGGLLLLLAAGDALVRGAVGVAARLGVPPLVIGLTIVAFGTSAPELLISVQAALAGIGGIAIGNVVGSNIANVLLVLGLPALLVATPCDEEGAAANSLFMVAVTTVFIAQCAFTPIGRGDGVILLMFLALFLGIMAWRTHQHKQEAANGAMPPDDVSGLDEAEPSVQTKPFWLILAFLVAGLLGLPAGAHVTVAAASDIARAWGVTEAAIGLTVVALGTSLPELATTLNAAVRRHAAVALGNVIGSNVFNLLAIIGITATIVPIDVPPQIMQFDIWVMLTAALLIASLALFRATISRLAGLAMILAYVIYIGAVFAIGRIA